MEIVNLDKVNSESNNQFLLDILHGLSLDRKKISSKYFYDDNGSDLFTQITKLEEYYLTDCEKEIFENNAGEIIAKFGDGPLNIVELGAGDGQKTIVLLKELTKKGIDFEYIAIDISKHALEVLFDFVKTEIPNIKFQALVGDYTQGLQFLNKNSNNKNICLFLGSNIGNFKREEMKKFLRSLWLNLKDGDDLLVGMDLVKDPEILVPAYSDKEGVTAQFNLNVLNRMNEVLGANFNVQDFRHYALYNPHTMAMESYLISLKDQSVTLSAINKKFSFYEMEHIHMEYSFKFSNKMISKLSKQCGFEEVQLFKDKREFYVDALWKVKK